MNLQEAKAHLRTQEPNIDDFVKWNAHTELTEQAYSIVINDKYGMAVMQKVLFYADKLGNDEQEAGYEARYDVAKGKAQKLINSARLTRELKIRAIEKELDEIRGFEYEVKSGDFSCLRISLQMEVDYDLKKEMQDK